MRAPGALLVLTLALGSFGCRTAEVQSGRTASETSAPIPAGSEVLPAGTSLKVTLNDELSTKQSQVGDDVRAVVTDPIRDVNGETLIPSGATLRGTVTGVAPSPRVGEPAAIRVDFNRLEVEGEALPVATEIIDAKPETEQNYGRAGKGAAIGGAGGAVLGAVIGRSVTGAVIGGLLGAGAGTAISLGTGDVQAKLPAGTPMTIRLVQPVELR